MVSLVLIEELCPTAQAQQIPCILGGMTPTELYTAYRLGCEAIKVFPASLAGTSLIRELQEPLNQILLFPTGGEYFGERCCFLKGRGGGSRRRQRFSAARVGRANWSALKRKAERWAAVADRQFPRDINPPILNC